MKIDTKSSALVQVASQLCIHNYNKQVDSQLMEKQEKFGYRMVFLETWEELSEFMKEAAKKNEAVPMVMWLFRV